MAFPKVEGPWDYNRTSKPRPNTPDNLCRPQKYFTPETAHTRITNRNIRHQKEIPPEAPELARQNMPPEKAHTKKHFRALCLSQLVNLAFHHAWLPFTENPLPT